MAAERQTASAHGRNRDGANSIYVESTLFIEASPPARIVSEKIFGRLLVVQSLEDLEALEIANDTP